MSYWEEDWHADGYDRRRSDRLAAPGGYGGTNSLYRSRSHGHQPAPNVHVYNYNRNDSRSPSPVPYRGRSPARMADTALLGEVEGLRRDLRRQSHSPAGWREPSPNYQNWQLEHIQRDANERLWWEREQAGRELEVQRLRDRIAREQGDTRMKSYEEQMRSKIEMERLKADLKAQQEKVEEEALREKILRDKEAADKKEKEARQRAIKDWEAKQKEEEDERKEAERRAVEAAERKRHQQKEEEKRVLAEYERRRREEKEEREKMKLQFKLEEEKEKEEERQREKEWELKQIQKKEMAEKLKKAEDEKLSAEMHKRLAKFGFQENQIEAMIDQEKAKKLPAGYSPRAAITSTALTISKPTYIKIHKDHLSVETLKYYRIPYEYDPVS